MLLSHHPPCDYDHTLQFGKLRICARCTGIALGASIGIALLVAFSFPQHSVLFGIAFLLPLPAVIDFITHELGLWKSNNLARWLSGLLLGSAIGWGGYALLHGGFLVLAWLVLLEFTVALLLRLAGQLDEFIKRYEKAVRGRD